MPMMGWVRFHRRYGAWPGLAALALQIVLSFGHIHVGNVHIASVFGGRVAHAADAGVAPSHQVAMASSKQKLPAQHPADDDDYCPICASIFLASTAFAAQPPQLPMPLGFERLAPIFAAEQGVSLSRPTYFQSRAPPAA
jgi:hypothetical protein